MWQHFLYPVKNSFTFLISAHNFASLGFFNTIMIVSLCQHMDVYTLLLWDMGRMLCIYMLWARKDTLVSGTGFSNKTVFPFHPDFADDAQIDSET